MDTLGSSENSKGFLTVTAGEGVAPLMILFTNDGFLIAQRVTRVTCEGHAGAGGEAAAMATPIHRNTRIEAGVRLHFHTCEQNGWSEHHHRPGGERTAVHVAPSRRSSHSDLLSYLMLKPAAERLLSVVNNRKRTLEVEIRK